MGLSIGLLVSNNSNEPNVSYFKFNDKSDYIIPNPYREISYKLILFNLLNRVLLTFILSVFVDFHKEFVNEGK